MLPPLPCGRRRLVTRAPWASATSGVPSSEASSATQSSTPGKAAARASSVAPIRSASLRAATIANTFVIAAADIVPRCMSMEVEAHITGTVWKVEVAVGDQVSDGDTVVILESMKMEMPVEVEDDGTVAEIRCKEGQSVQEGDVLVVLE